VRPRLLDLFCGAGGCSVGYHRAGFDVVGVDVSPNAGRRYPFEFHAGDWSVVVNGLDLDSFDAIHASPPCQAYSITRHSHSVAHPDLLVPVRDLLRSTGKPYVIENVVGAPLVNPITLCGTMFDLATIDDDGMTLYLKRHRLFESNVFIYPAGQCRCNAFRDRGWKVGGVYGGGSVDRAHTQNVRRGGYTPGKEKRAELIGADWMTQDQLSQAIPPAYTQHIGEQLIDHLAHP